MKNLHSELSELSYGIDGVDAPTRHGTSMSHGRGRQRFHPARFETGAELREAGDRHAIGAITAVLTNRITFDGSSFGVSAWGLCTSDRVVHRASSRSKGSNRCLTTLLTRDV